RPCGFLGATAFQGLRSWLSVDGPSALQPKRRRGTTTRRRRAAATRGFLQKRHLAPSRLRHTKRVRIVPFATGALELRASNEPRAPVAQGIEQRFPKP